MTTYSLLARVPPGSIKCHTIFPQSPPKPRPDARPEPSPFRPGLLPRPRDGHHLDVFLEAPQGRCGSLIRVVVVGRGSRSVGRFVHVAGQPPNKRNRTKKSAKNRRRRRTSFSASRSNARFFRRTRCVFPGARTSVTSAFASRTSLRPCGCDACGGFGVFVLLARVGIATRRDSSMRLPPDRAPAAARLYRRIRPP